VTRIATDCNDANSDPGGPLCFHFPADAISGFWTTQNRCCARDSRHLVKEICSRETERFCKGPVVGDTFEQCGSERKCPYREQGPPKVGNSVWAVWRQSVVLLVSSQRLAKSHLELPSVGSAHVRAVTVFEYHVELTVRGCLKLKDALNVDDCGPMDADEAQGI
jgi:hypothetical protein